MARSMFERYGGFAKISRVVTEFYGRVLASPVMRPYFAGVDMRRLVDHQTKFIAAVMGGPASFSNDTLERVHSHLGITEEAFATMAALLRETLEDFEFDDADVQAVCEDVLSRRNFIVKRS